MSFILYLILLVVGFVIVKFIYDSYLTKNTENRWNEFKQSNSIEAAKIENSSFGIKKEPHFSEIKPSNNSFDKLTATNILKNRTNLEAGVNKDVIIEEIELFELNEDLIPKHKKHLLHDLVGAIIYLNAIDEKGKKEAKEFFQQGNYESAIGVRAITIVDNEFAKQLKRKQKVDLEASLGNDGKMLVVILNEKGESFNHFNYQDFASKEVRLLSEIVAKSDINFVNGKVSSVNDMLLFYTILDEHMEMFRNKNQHQKPEDIELMIKAMTTRLMFRFITPI